LARGGPCPFSQPLLLVGLVQRVLARPCSRFPSNSLRISFSPKSSRRWLSTLVGVPESSGDSQCDHRPTHLAAGRRLCFSPCWFWPPAAAQPASIYPLGPAPLARRPDQAPAAGHHPCPSVSSGLRSASATLSVAFAQLAGHSPRSRGHPWFAVVRLRCLLRSPLALLRLA